jgi:hypothetical protein
LVFRIARISSQSGDATQRMVFKAVQAKSYDLTVFKIKWGNLTLKIYDKGGRVLRIDAKELRSGKMLDRLPTLLERMRDMLVRFLGTIQAAQVSFLDVGAFEVSAHQRSAAAGDWRASISTKPATVTWSTRSLSFPQSQTASRWRSLPKP